MNEKETNRKIKQHMKEIEEKAKVQDSTPLKKPLSPDKMASLFGMTYTDFIKNVREAREKQGSDTKPDNNTSGKPSA